MKIKFLSVAVLTALSASLTACGGSDSNGDANYVSPTPTPTSTTPTNTTPTNTTPTNTTPTNTTPTNTTPANPGTGNVVNNPITNGVEIAKHPTVVGQSYIRNAQANYDYVANTSSANNSAPVALDGANLQDDDMKNIVLGQETHIAQVQSKNAAGAALYIDAVSGAEVTNPTTTTIDPNTMQPITYNNAKKIEIAKDASGNNIEYTAKRYAGYIDGQPINDETFSTIAYNATDKAFTGTGTVTVKGPKNTATIQANNVTTILTGASTPSNKLIPTVSGTNYVPNATAGQPGTASNYYYSGLVAKQSSGNIFTSTNTYSVPEMVQNEAKTDYADDTGVRVFGANYKDLVAGTTEANTYAVPLLSKTTGKEVTFDGNSTFNNLSLANVQYGRVSNNVDVLQDSQSGLLNYTNRDYIGTSFTNRNAANAVNTYFYRGNNESTIAQMNALPANAEYQYYGHALTYGINDSSAAIGSGATNSVGDATTKTTLGDFVGALFNNSTKKLDGFIYNIGYTNPTGNTDPTKMVGNVNKLVTFTGDVHGNTVVGSSTLQVGDKSTGILKASFYGDKAQELGGAVSSNTTNEYGVAKWGGVFGAKRDVEAVKGNGNIFSPNPGGQTATKTTP